LDPPFVAPASKRLAPDSFYKKESQEKNVPNGWNFSCFAAHLNEQDSVLTDRTVCSVAGHLGPAIGVFSISGFHRLIIRWAWYIHSNDLHAILHCFL